MGDRNRSKRDGASTRGDAGASAPASTASVPAPASRDLVRAAVADHDGQLTLQAAIIHELLYEECTDNRVRALQAAQRGLTICREIVTDVEELAHTASLERGVSSLDRQLGGQSGGVVTTHEAPPFNPPSRETH